MRHARRTRDRNGSQRRMASRAVAAMRSVRRLRVVHWARSVLTAEATTGGFRLNGMSPWVTGGAAADVITIAATLVERGEATDRQLLMAVPTDTDGLSVAERLPLIGLTASSTGPVFL